MNGKQLGILVVLAGFAALTAYAVWVHGIVGLFAAVTANVATITVFTDLVISLSLVILWMWQDARARGVSAVPYVLVTLGFGSIGPLLYLLRREGSR